MSEPREWWINTFKETPDSALRLDPEIICVVEKSAFDELKAERDALVAAHDTQCLIAKQFQALFKEIEPEMSKLQAENERLKEAISYLPKFPTAPYEREMARKLERYRVALERVEAEGGRHTIAIAREALAEGDDIVGS